MKSVNGVIHHRFAAGVLVAKKEYRSRAPITKEVPRKSSGMHNALTLCHKVPIFSKMRQNVNR